MIAKTADYFTRHIFHFHIIKLSLEGRKRKPVIVRPSIGCNNAMMLENEISTAIHRLLSTKHQA